MVQNIVLFGASLVWNKLLRFFYSNSNHDVNQKVVLCDNVICFFHFDLTHMFSCPFRVNFLDFQEIFFSIIIVNFLVKHSLDIR